MYCILDDVINAYVAIFNINPGPGSIPVPAKIFVPVSQYLSEICKKIYYL